MKHYLSLCAVFKNEASYLEEWLRFYDSVGVEHFYLYDNESTDASVAMLAPWQAAGRVSVYRAQGRAVQLLTYSHCIKTVARDSAWIMFVDVDEYLFSPGQADLRVFLRPYEMEAGVVANWLMFGAGGHQHRPEGLTTLNFTRRCDANLDTFEQPLMKGVGLDPRNPASYYKVCHHVKSIVNTRDVVDKGRFPHNFRYREGRFPVNANRGVVPGPFNEDLSAIAQLRVNHYFSRSWDEFQQKIQRGRADTGSVYDAQDMIRRNRMFDQIEDRDIFPLAKRVEADMRAQKTPRAMP